MSIRESIDCGIIMPMLNNTSLWFILGGVKFGDFQRFWHPISLTSLMLAISNSPLYM